MQTIGTAREFFDEVVGYNMQQYKQQPNHLPSAFNLSISLFSMHEWLWNGNETQLKAYFSTNFKNKGAFCGYVQNQCDAFKYIRDLANASKHVSLNNASTKATHITHTSGQESVIGKGLIGVAKIGGRGVVSIADSDLRIDFEFCADEVHEYWKKLLTTLGL